MAEFDDFGPTRVLSIVVTVDGMTRLMWWPRAREVTLKVEAEWEPDWHDRRGRPPHKEYTLNVVGDMQSVVAKTMQDAWAAAQQRWAEEDARAAVAGPVLALEQ